MTCNTGMQEIIKRQVVTGRKNCFQFISNKFTRALEKISLNKQSNKNGFDRNEHEETSVFNATNNRYGLPVYVIWATSNNAVYNNKGVPCNDPNHLFLEKVPTMERAFSLGRWSSPLQSSGEQSNFLLPWFQIKVNPQATTSTACDCNNNLLVHKGGG